MALRLSRRAIAPELPAPPLLRPRPRRRQWGADRSRSTLPAIAPTPSRRALIGARFAVFGTVIAWCAYVIEQIVRLLRSDLSLRSVAEAAAYLLIVTVLTGSAAAYLVTRLGYLNRTRQHRRESRAVIDTLFDAKQPSLTVIVPSYQEDARVVRQTLLSAALQEYPDLRVVLLIDDPPDPADDEKAQLLQAARDLPDEIALFLEGPRQLFEEALENFERNVGHDDEPFVNRSTLHDLASNYETAAEFFRIEVADYPIVDHTDEFLVAEVLERLIEDLSTTATALEHAANLVDARISHQRARQLYRRLAWIFRAELSSFERKRFASLSHEANKAMNLNSYIGLMGGRYNIEPSVGGDVLLATHDELYDLAVPDPDYVLTLDADSTLLPEYCMRLVSFMEQDCNAGVAVVQTPYSAYRGATQRIERISGATTDLQHLVHQGLTRHGATFWVGANAVLRKRALDDIVVEEEERGFTVRRYVQDRTVIEDTESSIDLRAKGWQLCNYPERLSYSATPPDFGSLVVQRQRWANGGLVILPKMRGLLRRGSEQESRASIAELFLRLNYLASVTWASFGLLVLLFYPFDNALLSRTALLTALPYFVAQANDLKRTGYKRSDVARLYGFNLLLLPVNLSGTVKSLLQVVGGQKIAFARTPKVTNRTVAPLSFVALPFLLIAWSGYTFARDLHQQTYTHAAFAAVNGLLTTYAVVAFIGMRHSMVDMFLNLRERIYRPVRPTDAPEHTPDWVTVLYHGNSQPTEQRHAAPLAAALAAQDQAERTRMTPSAHRMANASRDDAAGGPRRRKTDRLIDLTEEPLRIEVDDTDLDAAAALLAECVRILTQSADVTIRPQGAALEIHLNHHLAPTGDESTKREQPR